MRYHFTKPTFYLNQYGRIYICEHPVYTRCTLYEIADKGLAVIQQRYDPNTRTTWWTEIDPWLTDVIYLQAGFRDIFDKRAKPGKDRLFPTMTVRQIMWALKMKPLPKERWETVFDRKDI